MSMVSITSLTPFSWNPIEDLQTIFQYAFMRNAFTAGTFVAIVAGIVGYFVILRNLSFAGHALSHSGFAGATAAVVIGASPVSGLLVFTVGSALIMGALGKRLHGRDVIVGVVLAWTLGLGIFFLSLYSGYANQAYSILFGQILGISQNDVMVTCLTSVATLLAMVLIYRPLLFASLDEEIAESRGIPTRLVGIIFLIIIALAVSAATQVVGVLLIFSLLVTPAAIAERLSTRPPIAILISVLLAVLFTWAGLLIAFYFPYPVSFFITSFAFLAYVIVRVLPVTQEGTIAFMSGKRNYLPENIKDHIMIQER